MRRIIILTAITLIAAACGGDGTTASTMETLDDASSGTVAPVTTTTTAAVGPGELPESDYPNVVVADLAGGEVNLKELVLETEPVLLWFWAPH